MAHIFERLKEKTLIKMAFLGVVTSSIAASVAMDKSFSTESDLAKFSDKTPPDQIKHVVAANKDAIGDMGICGLGIGLSSYSMGFLRGREARKNASRAR